MPGGNDDNNKASSANAAADGCLGLFLTNEKNLGCLHSNSRPLFVIPCFKCLGRRMWESVTNAVEFGVPGCT